MESHRYERTAGQGVNSLEILPAGDSKLAFCQHLNGRGHRCRMPSLDNSGLCMHHARALQAMQTRDQEATAEELLATVGDFADPAEVNRFLGTLVKQVVRKRVSRRDAVTLAYLSQLLLNSLSAMDRQRREKSGEEPEVE